MVDLKGFRGEESGQSGSFMKKTAVFVLALIALVLLFNAVGYFFDFIQLKEIGDNFTDVFKTRLVAALGIQMVGFFAIFVLVFINIFAVRRNLYKLGIERGVFESKRLSLLITLFISLLLGSIVSGSVYEKWLMFSNSVSFGKTDPLFNKDIGYYVFQRPFVMAAVDAFVSIWFFVLGITALLYWTLGTVFGGRKLKILFGVRSVLLHFCVNIGVLILLYCIKYLFKAEGLLFGSFGELRGAGYTDKLVWLNCYRAAPFLLAILAFISIFFIAKGKLKRAVKTVLIFPAFWVLALFSAFLVQTVVVSPNEVIRESESISQNIEMTQSAYGLDGISENVFDVKNDLKAEDLRENKTATDNIRIIDLNANLTVLNQIQGIRNYYKFNETDIVPYYVNGQKTAVAITAREITKENLSDSADTYINRKLRYTHGFGVAMNTINRVSEQGQPEFLIKDIPPRSADGIQKIKQPRIYYGELTNDYVIVGNSKYKELDYSQGQDDIEFSYNGSGGLKLSFLNRLMFAAKYADVRLLISDLVSSESRILINRNIIKRLEMAAPFLQYDADPYIVIDSDGGLKWVVDAYTTTKFYPCSQSYGDFNYIRNSIKAVVDAYNGSVTFYIADKNDPIALCYQKIYPTLFSDGDMPEGIKKYTKYPEYLFGVQAAVYGKYHVSNPTTFYNKNDMWVVAKERYGTSAEEKEVVPYYNMMKLEGESDAELLMTIPYTLANKDNMVAWLAVRNEWNNYGGLRVYKFPKDINVYGPMQIENRINSDTEISKELNLWSQGGSKVIRGNMIVVPVRNSILYVEPIYIASSNQSALPELKQVVAAYNEKIVMKNSLNEALYALFNEKAPAESTAEIADEKPSYLEAARRVIEEFKKVKEATSQNNWSGFGESMNALEGSVGELEESIKEN